RGDGPQPARTELRDHRAGPCKIASGLRERSALRCPAAPALGRASLGLFRLERGARNREPALRGLLEPRVPGDRLFRAHGAISGRARGPDDDLGRTTKAAGFAERFPEAHISLPSQESLNEWYR